METEMMGWGVAMMAAMIVVVVLAVVGAVWLVRRLIHRGGARR